MNTPSTQDLEIKQLAKDVDDIKHTLSTLPETMWRWFFIGFAIASATMFLLLYLATR